MRRWLMIASCLFLAACGFQLRGAYSLPFDSLHVAQPESSELHALIKRHIEASTQTRIVSNPKEAQAVLSVLGDVRQKDILSLNSAGRVREYQLVRSFTFRLHDSKGRDWISPSTIRLSREMTFDDTRVLAKEAEESLIWRDIQNDLVQQLLRRLAAAKLAKAEN